MNTCYFLQPQEQMEIMEDFQSPVHTREPAAPSPPPPHLAGLLVASKPRCLHRDDYVGVQGDGADREQSETCFIEADNQSQGAP